MTVDNTARIAIVLKKLNEAHNRLYEATKIYEHILDEKATPIEYGERTDRSVLVNEECLE
jgi:hypothetical protein